MSSIEIIPDPPKMLAEDSPNVYYTIMTYLSPHQLTIMQGVARMFYEDLCP